MSAPAAGLARVAEWGPDAAVVFGSGLAALPPGARIDDELSYEALGWPLTAVPGHENRLRLVRLAVAGSAGAGDRELRLALACGRPHLYEGWNEEELGRPVRDLVAAGARRLLLTNSCGALRPPVSPGDVVACSAAVDLQRPPVGEAPPRLAVCRPEAAASMAAALRPAAGRTGVYVAVAGPQFETPAEVAWLAGYGDVVGMSAAPELRAAAAGGATCGLLGLVANRAAEVGSHEDVLACGGRLAAALAGGLAAVLLARWPEIAHDDRRNGGDAWTS